MTVNHSHPITALLITYSYYCFKHDEISSFFFAVLGFFSFLRQCYDTGYGSV